MPALAEKNTPSILAPFEAPIRYAPLEPPLEAIIRYEDQLVSRAALSRWLGLSADCLGEWARQGLGPQPVIRVGKHKTACKVGDVLKWLASQAGVPGKQYRRRTKPEKKSA